LGSIAAGMQAGMSNVAAGSLFAAAAMGSVVSAVSAVGGLGAAAAAAAAGAAAFNSHR
jgi:hypothetical protein